MELWYLLFRSNSSAMSGSVEMWINLPECGRWFDSFTEEVTVL